MSAEEIDEKIEAFEEVVAAVKVEEAVVDTANVVVSEPIVVEVDVSGPAGPDNSEGEGAENEVDTVVDDENAIVEGDDVLLNADDDSAGTRSGTRILPALLLGVVLVAIF